MIVYDRLWETMKKKGISQYSLIKDYHINEAQLHRLRKNMVIKTITLDRLCEILDCEVEDLPAHQGQSQKRVRGISVVYEKCPFFPNRYK